MERINKYISDTGFCTRREADRLVADARVTINHKCAVPGDKVLQGEIVRIDGEVLRKQDVPEPVTSTTSYGTPLAKSKICCAARASGTRFNQLTDGDKAGALSPPENPKSRSIRNGRKTVVKSISPKSGKPNKGNNTKPKH